MHHVIVGPPGTGKTRFLIEGVGAWLQGTTGHRALFCSHTRAAAKTAVERWGVPNPRLDISTLHSYCFHELKLSRAQTVDDAKLVQFLAEFGLDLDENGEGRKYMDTIAMAGSTKTKLEEAYKQNAAPGTWFHFEAVAKSYRKWKDQFGYIDFTDMLQLFVKRATHSAGHLLMMVDEAQDLTPLHWDVIHKIMELTPKMAVMVAGDPDQCVYAYGGADANGMHKFKEDYKAEYRVLEQSYRIPHRVHEVAEEVISRVEDRVKVAYKPQDRLGLYQEYPDLQWLYPRAKGGGLDADRESLIIFNDRFIRQEVEERLMELAIPYEAASGMPAPLQNKAGRALRIAFKDELTDDDPGQLKRCLNDRGRAIYDSVGPGAILDKLRRRDYSVINVAWHQLDYFQRVDFTKPPKVRIATIHGAKGMEADDVHLLRAQSQAAVDYATKNPDAQHRLFYVGVTRAREKLFTYGGDNEYEL